MRPTAMSAGEEHLFDVGDLPRHVVDVSFVLVRVSRPLSFRLMMTALIAFGDLGVRTLPLGLSTRAEGWYELDTAFV